MATPVGTAAKRGYIDITKCLIDNGADINKLCPLKYTSRHYAVIFHQYPAAELLIGLNANDYLSIKSILEHNKEILLIDS